MIKKIWNKLKYFYYKMIFREFGYGSTLRNPLNLNCPGNISIGRSTAIGYKAWLAARPVEKSGNSSLVIGNGCSIGNFNHIYATRKITIQDHVLTADKVYISDNLHNYEDIHMPVKMQPLNQKNDVMIGEGSWLGENVCIIGCTIGKHCVIGANTVVTKDVPDYSVVVGNPQKIIKRYCFQTSSWRKTDPDGVIL